MIEIQNLVKIYESGKQKVKGVQDVSLTINDGEIFGIVGYSGAGKEYVAPVHQYAGMANVRKCEN